MDNLRELRLALVNAQERLTEARDNWTAYLGGLLKDVKIKATTKEAREIEIAGLFGNDPHYRSALSVLRTAEYACSRAEAILESAKDARRKWEWDIRLRLADGLFRQGVQSDHQDYAGDSAFDDSTDEYTHPSVVDNIIARTRNVPRTPIGADDDFPF